MVNDFFSIDIYGDPEKHSSGMFSEGEDSAPLFSLVRDPSPSHWGKTTSKPRSESEEYLKFVKSNREKNKDGSN